MMITSSHRSNLPPGRNKKIKKGRIKVEDHDDGEVEIGGGELDIKNCTTVLGLRQMWPNSLYYRIMSIFDLRYGE